MTNKVIVLKRLIGKVETFLNYQGSTVPGQPRVSMAFKNLSILVLWTKVTSALDGLCI